MRDTKPLILISGGSGLGYVLDVMSYIKAHFQLIQASKITLVLSTYDVNLFTWFLSICQTMQLDQIETLNIDFIIALTSGQSSRHSIQKIDPNLIDYHAQYHRKIILGRLDLDQLFQEKTKRQIYPRKGSVLNKITVATHKTYKTQDSEKCSVFCHGGPALTAKVFSKAEKYNCQVHKSVTFS